MSTEMQTKVQASPAQNFMPAQTGLLQRQCTLCNTPGLVEDSGRDKEKLTLQHSSTDQAGTTTVPRFGHDFSRVSVHSIGPWMIQTKLKINEPWDIYEQEADRVADAVMRMPEPGVQRQVEPEEEEEEERLEAPLANQITPLVQRKPDPVEEEDEEKQIQPKNNTGMAPQVTPRVAHDIHSFKGTGQPLPASERAFFEPRFGRDFSNVRVHTNERSARTAQFINARAFTLGRDVVFGAGQYQPHTDSGNRLLAHELTHVIQQQSRSTTTSLIQRAHISINAAVTRYKSQISNPTLLKQGQFYWSLELKKKIQQKSYPILSRAAALKTAYQSYVLGLRGKMKARYKKYLEAKDGSRVTHTSITPDLVKDWKRLIEMSYNPRNESTYIGTLWHVFTRLLGRQRSDTNAKLLKAILGTGYFRNWRKRKQYGKRFFQWFWGKYRPSATALPNLDLHARIDKLEALAWYEYGACSTAGVLVAKRFLGRGGFAGAGRSRSKRISYYTPLCSWIKKERAFTGAYTRGDVVKYRRNLGTAITKVKAAIDDGYLIHAQILSGKCCGGNRCKTSAFCSCVEHSIIVIGYDGNKFVFWDPDAMESIKFGGGFGFLYYDTTDRRFSTAETDAKLKVKADGNHADGQHRYQVLRVWTI